MFVNKLLIIKSDKLEYCLTFDTFNSKPEIVKNPVPVLWNHNGIYGWIPVEVIKNEISVVDDIIKLDSCKAPIIQLRFIWQQAHRLRPDVGKILEKQENRIAGLTELLNEQMLEELANE